MSLPPILVAEDNADDLFFFKRRLRQAGVANPIVTFENGQQAISFLSELCQIPPVAGPSESPCLLFLDIKMPLKSGFEVLAWARRQAAFAKLPIVMLSGSAATSDIAKATELGANQYLVKPPPANALENVVRGALDQASN